MNLIDKDALLDKAEEYYKAKERESAYTGNREICVRWDDAIFLINEAKPVVEIEISPELSQRMSEANKKVAKAVMKLDEFCESCVEYDQNNHICPQFNHVIETALNDVWKDAMGLRKVIEPEIIRCGDCMHNGSFDTDCPIYWPGKEFCNFGERKDDE